MDTISTRENNNIMPMVGVVLGAIALLLSIVAFVKVTKVKSVVDQQQEKVATIDQISSQANSAAAAADKANGDIRKLTQQTQDAVNQIGTMIGDLRASVTKIEESSKARPVAHSSGKGGAVETAGPGEYIVRRGDGGAKIAREHGISLAALQAANPGINWRRLRIGQKINLPGKK